MGNTPSAPDSPFIQASNWVQRLWWKNALTRSKGPKSNLVCLKSCLYDIILIPRNWSDIFFFFFGMFIYFWRRERQSLSRGGAERKGDTDSKVGSRLWAVSMEPSEGPELTSHEITTWAAVGCLTDRATQAPSVEKSFYLKFQENGKQQSPNTNTSAPTVT